MTDPAPGTGAVTRWRVLALVAATVALLAGCELATGTVRTATELQQAGIRNPNLQYRDGVATVEYDADPNPLEARAEQDRAAAVIWENLPFRIDRIVISSRGGGFDADRDYPRALLETQLGPRPANLDQSESDIARRAVLIATIVAAVLLVLVVVIILLVVRAVRRRPRPQPAGAWPQGGGQQPWGQPPGYGRGPWEQPPPPGQPSWGPPVQGQPPPQGWPPPQPPAQPPPPPTRGPGDTQRLEPGPPPRDDQGPEPPP